MKYNVARGYVQWDHAKMCPQGITPHNRAGMRTWERVEADKWGQSQEGRERETENRKRGCLEQTEWGGGTTECWVDPFIKQHTPVAPGGMQVMMLAIAGSLKAGQQNRLYANSELLLQLLLLPPITAIRTQHLQPSPEAAQSSFPNTLRHSRLED